MKFLETSKDGGPESTVWAHWLVEIKSLFSIVLLRFEDGTRDAYHSHAFNSVSWVLKGELMEYHQDEDLGWELSFRGPWARTWKEIVNGQEQVLTNGRKRVA